MPTYQDLMNPTLRALNRLGGSAMNGELVAKVVEDLQLPEDITQQSHGTGGQTELEYRLAWARTYLGKVELIENSSRGVWSLTAKGASTEYVDPKEVSRYVRTLHRSRSDSGPSDLIENDLDEPVIEDPGDETAVWRERLLETLLGLSPSAFERLCQRLLRESGFIEVEVTGRAGDGGIDGHGIIRVAGLISFPVLFQCKRYSGNVGSSVVRDFRGAMVGRADKGLLITTGGFTREAALEATRDGAPPIDLIGGDLLAAKLKELNLGVHTRTVEVVEVDTEWFNSL